MEGRIDYVRIRVSGEKVERIGLQQEYERICKELTEKHGIERKSYDDTLSYDRVLRRWYTNFNVWGELADKFFDNLSEGEFNRVHRLDYRVECLNEALDLEEVGLIAVKHAKRKGLRRSFNDGPIQSKSNGRDTGGPSVVIGGVGSSRRISLYQRGHELPGVEAQISGEKLKHIIKAAYDTSLSMESIFHNELRYYMRNELDKLCRERLLHPLKAFGADGELSTTMPTDELDTRVYEQISLLWEFLSPDNQGELISHLSATYDQPKITEAPETEDEPAIWEEIDRMEAYDREMREQVSLEDKQALEEELYRVKRDWPYHNLEYPD